MPTPTPPSSASTVSKGTQCRARSQPEQQFQMEVDLVVGRAAWWLPAPAKHIGEAVNLTFAAALKDFLCNVSFHCYGKLVESGRSFVERFLWTIFHVTALTTLIAFLWNTYDHQRQMLVTTIHDPLYPIRKVAFPAVSICSLNRMSKAAVVHYARKLSQLDPLGRDLEFFYEELKMFGYLYFNLEDPKDYELPIAFQSFLDQYGVDDDELFYNTRRHLRMLTPNCSDMFVQCRLAGKIIPCEEEFQETATFRGFCCTFNNDGKYATPRIFRKRFFGIDMGLEVVLKASPKDDFHKLFELDGFLVSIYEPIGYPDPYSGSIEERFAQTGIDTLLPISAKIFDTVPQARVMERTVRNCLFENELQHFFDRKYSFSKCISACRIRSIIILCRCIPFSSPDYFFASLPGKTYCTLQHLECLNRYEFKWLNVITSRANVSGLEYEMEDALFCPDCLPSCTETRYKVKGAMALNLQMPRTLTSGNNDTELAMVRIYFAETHIQYFRQIIKNPWYEIFGTIGNICGIIAGFSLIGICEVLFFLAKQLWQTCKAEVNSERKQRRKKSKDVELIILP